MPAQANRTERLNAPSVIVDLDGIDHHQLSASGGKSRFGVPRTEPAEPIPMLHHDPPHRHPDRNSWQPLETAIWRGGGCFRDTPSWTVGRDDLR